MKEWKLKVAQWKGEENKLCWVCAVASANVWLAYGYPAETIGVPNFLPIVAHSNILTFEIIL